MSGCMMYLAFVNKIDLKLGIVLNTCNPSTCDVEAGSGVQGHPLIHKEFKVNLRPCLKMRKVK